MTDYLEIGPTPYDETCAQVGQPDYATKARAECKRFIEQLRRQFGNEPDGARLVIKPNFHDFGDYYEVAIKYDDSLPEAVEYAFKIEGNTPANWDTTTYGDRVRSGEIAAIIREETNASH